MQEKTEQHSTKRRKTQHNPCQASLNLKASHDTSKLKLLPQSPGGMPFQSYPQQYPPYQQQQQPQPQQQTMEQQYQYGPNHRHNTVEDNQRRQYEQQYAAWAQAAANGHSYPPPPDFMIVPNENDVLGGRDGSNRFHSGNDRLRCLVLGRMYEYKAATKEGKWEIARYVSLLYDICKLQVAPSSCCMITLYVAGISCQLCMTLNPEEDFCERIRRAMNGIY